MSHVAQAGTSSALAIKTRGAHGCVRKTRDRLAGLDEERLVVLEAAQRGDDRVERFPRARGAARAAVDDQIVGPLGDLRIEVVHQHAQRGFLRPSLAGERRAARRADVAAEGAHARRASGTPHARDVAVDRERRLAI